MKAMPVKRALISVSDKTGVVEFARKIADMGIEILSTGGTARALSENNIPVTSVDSYTGHPEIMDGRVKTLHPRVHGGILAVRDNKEHVEQMEANGIKPIDLVVVNLYPFEKTVAKPDVAIEDAIENIDIGGPTMVRSSAKNHAYVTIVVDPADYSSIIKELEENKAISFDTRKRFAVKAYRHTADYDAAIDAYLSRVYLDEEIMRLSYNDGQKLRYGENPHQKAAFYKDCSVTEPSMAKAQKLHGKELSYNNIVDGDAAIEAVKEIADFPGAVVVKHTNPCGFATGNSLEEALEAAWNGDPVSAFGSIIAVTRVIDEAAARVLEGRFVEMLIAPDFTEGAIDYLKNKSSLIRLISIGDLKSGKKGENVLKQVTGGILKQTRDIEDYEKWEVKTKAPFAENKEKLARFAWKACKHVKSNAIVLAQEYKEGMFRVIGMGAGQPNRVDSLRKLAVTRAIENLKNQYENEGKAIPEDNEFPEFFEMVLASDAFFPFSDAVEEARKVGIRFVVQPGGSKRDSEVIDACNNLGMAMVFTGMRHFRH